VREGTVSAKISSIASTSFRSACRRSAIASRTCRSWRVCFLETVSREVPQAGARPFRFRHWKILGVVLVAGQHPGGSRNLIERLVAVSDKEWNHRRGTCRWNITSPSSIRRRRTGEALFQEGVRTPSSATSSSERSRRKELERDGGRARYLGIPPQHRLKTQDVPSGFERPGAQATRRLSRQTGGQTLGLTPIRPSV